MTEHIIAAIIGYWRSGASNYDIYLLTNIPVSTINRIINQYQEYLEENERESN